MHDSKQNLLNASFYVAQEKQKERLLNYSTFCSVHFARTCIIEKLERLSLGCQYNVWDLANHYREGPTKRKNVKDSRYL